MPRRPATSGYARLAQDEEDEADDAHETDEVYAAVDALSQSAPRHQYHLHQQQQQQQRARRRRHSAVVDSKAINARLERWADEIAAKFKIHRVKGKTLEEEKLRIDHSVFQAPDWVRPLTAEQLEMADDGDGDNYDGNGSRSRQARAAFEATVASVRAAIDAGVHPLLISQGSSGSYFARNEAGKVVGVFKPKDEEPYASRNPKWTKWIHRNLFPCFFGRACLIPNLSYVSEAAAYVLDTRLRTNIVPYTDIVWLSSKSFFYDFWDRRRAWLGQRPLPPKVGSFQVFLKGYTDATIFLRQHPWPDTSLATADDLARRRRRRRRQHQRQPHQHQPLHQQKRQWSDACRDEEQAYGDDSTDDEQDGQADDYADAAAAAADPAAPADARSFQWTEPLKQAFREELEKLVILDYIMRNTDRGLDNWMIKIDWDSEQVSIVAEPPKKPDGDNLHHLDGGGGDDDDDDDDRAPRPRPIRSQSERAATASDPYRRREAMVAEAAVNHRGSSPMDDGHRPSRGATIKIGAIDNSLSWPWKHPDAWRSFPFGWLFLPVSLIGQPFSQKTREHFLPLLTSTAWWSGTQMALRHVFAQDADFKESMFARQMAVMKGQAWNVVETLKQPDHGPLELTRRTRVCVWDDLVDVPVAIPLRVPSVDMQRRGAAGASGPGHGRAHRYANDQAEEIDIAVAISPQSPESASHLGSPLSDLPNPNRFELSSARTPGMSHDYFGSFSPASPDQQNHHQQQHHHHHHDGYRRQDSMGPRGRRRPPQQQQPPPVLFGGDDLEADLGYAAAQGMERNQRKVIVERLEAVKSKNPVFTWC